MRKDISKILVSFIIFVVGMLLEHNVIDISAIPYVNGIGISNIILVVFVIGYLIIGGEVVREAARNILNGQIFDENFLMTIATIGAFMVGEYPEAMAVMLFYQIGETFQEYAVDKARKSIADLAPNAKNRS